MSERGKEGKRKEEIGKGRREQKERGREGR